MLLPCEPHGYELLTWCHFLRHFPPRHSASTLRVSGSHGMRMWRALQPFRHLPPASKSGAFGKSRIQGEPFWWCLIHKGRFKTVGDRRNTRSCWSKVLEDRCGAFRRAQPLQLPAPEIEGIPKFNASTTNIKVLGIQRYIFLHTHTYTYTLIIHTCILYYIYIYIYI
jgi:hypothetical protein